MVTSGAQSKAINDWLIPSVEVSYCQFESIYIDGMPSFIGTSSDIQTFGLMGKSGESHPGKYLKSSELRPLQTQQARRSQADFVQAHKRRC